MRADHLVHGELSHETVGAYYEVFNELGSGFLEQVYKRAMVIALQDRGIASEREVPAAVYFRGRSVGDYRMDLSSRTPSCSNARRPRRSPSPTRSKP